MRAAAATLEKQRYEEQFRGKTVSKNEWQRYFKLPDRLHEVGTMKPHELCEQTEYIEPVKAIAKQLRDDVVFGKPLFQKYTRPLRPEDLNYEMGGVFKLFKIMH